MISRLNNGGREVYLIRPHTCNAANDDDLCVARLFEQWMRGLSGKIWSAGSGGCGDGGGHTAIAVCLKSHKGCDYIFNNTFLYPRQRRRHQQFINRRLKMKYGPVHTLQVWKTPSRLTPMTFFQLSSVVSYIGAVSVEILNIP